MQILRRIGLLVTAATLTGCMVEEGPLGPGAEGDQVLAEVEVALQCRVDLRGGSMTCAPGEASLPAGVLGALVGGQGTYVLLEASNVSYNETAEIFSADVTVRNLITQTLGTSDGVT